MVVESRLRLMMLCSRHRHARRTVGSLRSRHRPDRSRILPAPAFPVRPLRSGMACARGRPRHLFAEFRWLSDSTPSPVPHRAVSAVQVVGASSPECSRRPSAAASYDATPAPAPARRDRLDRLDHHPAPSTMVETARAQWPGRHSCLATTMNIRRRRRPWRHGGMLPCSRTLEGGVCDRHVRCFYAHLDHISSGAGTP